MRGRNTLVATVVLAIAPNLAVAQRIAGNHAVGTVPMPVPLDASNKFSSTLVRVGDDMYIAGQPTRDGLHQLRDRGVTTVVNLRTPEEMVRVGFDEAAEAASLGMKYVNLPVGSPDLPYSPATLDQFSKTLEAAPGGVLLHCTIGWRASHLWTAYLIRERGMSVDSALKHGRAINLMDTHQMSSGRQPVEDFLGRDLEPLRRMRTP